MRLIFEVYCIKMQYTSSYLLSIYIYVLRDDQHLMMMFFCFENDWEWCDILFFSCASSFTSIGLLN